MKKWTWVLLFVGAAALLMLITRENFDNYAAALAAVGQTAGYTNTNAPVGTANTGVGTAAAGGAAPEPKSAAHGVSIIDGFCKRPNVQATPPVCPAGSTFSVGKCRGGDSMTAAQAAAAGLTYDSFLNQYTKAAGPTCPAGYTQSFSGSEGECEDANKTAPMCPPGTATTTTPTPAPTTGTTGGSGVVPASNSGGKGGNIFGPAFAGFGETAEGPGAGGPGRKSTREYPTLFGPTPKASTLVEGAGVMKPSQHETLVKSGALPRSANTGSDPNSQFFGSSRVPGDQDLFPNPYQEFTPSIGSAKTEPVPFLSDFSAFAS